MRLIEDSEAAAWLEGLAGSPEEFNWDEGNRAKNVKHGVESRDVEAIFLRQFCSMRIWLRGSGKRGLSAAWAIRRC